MSETTRDELSRDTLFSLLSNPRRRFVIRYLYRADESVTLQELATEVAAWENQTEPEKLTDQERKRVYVSLYQTHVPKLEEVGVIEYDNDSGEITLTERTQGVRKYLDGDVEDRRPWELYYLALALVGTLLYGGLALGLVDVGQVTSSLLGLGFVLVLAALSLLHYFMARREQTW